MTISFTGGVRPELPTQPIRIGDESHGLRVLSSKLDGHTYHAQVEGRRGACSEFLLSTPWQVKQVIGGRATLHRDDEWRFRLSPDSHRCDGGNAGPYQVWRFQVEFEP